MIGVLLCASALAAPPTKKAVESKELQPLPQEKQPETYNVVVLQGLNKVTGQISRFDGMVGTVMRFGTLEIAGHRCWKSSPEERPENAALLEVSELKPGEAPHQIFLGWMFSSSPGLSSLEHPVYDLTVLACELRNEDGGKKK